MVTTEFVLIESSTVSLSEQFFCGVHEICPRTDSPGWREAVLSTVPRVTRIPNFSREEVTTTSMGET
jgi:hypothetical protein